MTAEVGEGTVRERILVAMARHPHGEKAGTIAALAGVADSTARKYLAWLLADGLVRETMLVGEFVISPAGREEAAAAHAAGVR